MIDLYLWLVAMLLASIVTQTLYRRTRTPGFKFFFNVVVFVGVFVHELAHYTLGVIFGAKRGKFRVEYRSGDKTRVAPHGSVGNPEFDRHSFVQTFVIGFAPLFMSTFLFMFCLDVIFRVQTEAWVKIVAIVFCVSLFVGSEPSGQDIKLIGITFNKDPNYSLYQIFLVLLSGILVWLFVDLYFISLPFEVLYYIEYFLFLAVFYYGLKLSLWTIYKLFKAIRKQFGKTKVSSPKSLTRRRRFKKFKDPEEREAQW